MNHRYKLLLAALPIAFLAACGGDDDLDDRLDIADPKVRLVHAIPAAPNVSLFREDVVQAADVTNMPYAKASNYFDVPTGAATWKVRTATGNLEVGSSVFDASRGNKFSLVAVPGEGTLTQVINIADPYNKSLTSNEGRVRVLNAAYNRVSIDAYVYTQDIDTTGASVTPNFAGVAYTKAYPGSGSDSLDFKSETTYNLTLTAAGSKVPVFRSPIALTKNADLLIVVLPDRVLSVSTDSGTPAVELTNSL